MVKRLTRALAGGSQRKATRRTSAEHTRDLSLESRSTRMGASESAAKVLEIPDFGADVALPQRAMHRLVD